MYIIIYAKSRAYCANVGNPLVWWCNLLKMASLLDRDVGAHLQEGDESLLHSLLLEVIGLELSCMWWRSWLPLNSLL